MDDKVIYLRIGSKKFLSLCLSFLALISVFFATSELFSALPKRLIVLRVDDIQDFAFRDAQLFLLNWSYENKLPISIAVIAGMFGEDTQILNAVKLAVESGTEVGAHGWKHENLTKLQLWEQLYVLFQAKKTMNELLGVKLKLLVPPSFSFNDDTIYAMREQSYSIISTCVDYHKPIDFPEVRSIPATVELSIIEDGVWKMKNNKSIIEEVELSFKKYGYAAIVTHPQEFICNKTLDYVSLSSFFSLINNLRETCQFTTFDELKFLIN